MGASESDSSLESEARIHAAKAALEREGESHEAIARTRLLQRDKQSEEVSSHSEGDQVRRATAVERLRGAVESSAETLSRWDKAKDVTERRYLLERIGRHMMLLSESPNDPMLARHFDDPRLLGQYDGDHISVRDDLLKDDDPRMALETYLHEYRHNVQAYEVEKSKGALAHQVSADRTRDLGQRYVSPSEDEGAYLKQFAEQDSREFARTMADAILEKRAEFGRSGTP